MFFFSQAPEVARAAMMDSDNGASFDLRASKKSDVYSFGIMIYLVVTGETRPYGSLNDF